MEKIFTYGNARKDKDASFFKANKQDDHKALLKAICCQSFTGRVSDFGGFISVPRHAAHNVSQHLIKHGWTLGV